MNHPIFLKEHYKTLEEFYKAKSDYFENRTKQLEDAIKKHRKDIPDYPANNDYDLWNVLNNLFSNK